MRVQILASMVRRHLGAADLEWVVSREGFLRKWHGLWLTEGAGQAGSGRAIHKGNREATWLLQYRAMTWGV